MNTQPTQAQTVTADSGFAYTPPPQADYTEQQEFDASVRDVIAEIEGEFNQTPLDETTEAIDPAKVEVPNEADQQPEGMDQPPKDAKPEEDPAIARGMERLIQREVALQAREAAYNASASRVAELEAEVGRLRKAAMADDVVTNLAVSPTDTIKSLGHDPATIVRLMIAEDLKARNQPVPPELAAFVDKAADRREMNLLKAKLAATEKAQAQAQEFNALQLGGVEYVKSHTTGAEWKQMPVLTDLAKSNPVYVHKEIMKEILEDAQRRVAADPGGQPMTYQQAARNVEARLAEIKSFFGPAQSQAAPTNAPKPATPTPAQPKPPAKPIAPWRATNQTKDLEAQGLDEAIREFNKHEAARLARR